MCNPVSRKESPSPGLGFVRLQKPGPEIKRDNPHIASHFSERKKVIEIPGGRV
jgi:hypothetical protein